jgi:hypothetical protein
MENIYKNKEKNESFIIKKLIINHKNIKKIYILISLIYIINLNKRIKMKVGLCTMGKLENLYIKEFINYYIKIGIDKIFIYDDNDLNSEKILDVIGKLYRNHVIVYENIKNKIKNQSDAFTQCYNSNKNIYDWLLMVDIDEYLFIVNDTLKNYLSNSIFDKCDFIKFHWLLSKDNNLLHYDNRSLFERFKGPYIKSKFVKSIIKGKIKDLKYWIHSPYKSPIRNITCNNVGEIIKYKNLNFEAIHKINIQKAYIIHFCYKSTEEYINKLKRGYSNWFDAKFYKNKVKDYFRDNEKTKEKLEYFQKELNINIINILKF